MIEPFGGLTPRVDRAAFVHPSAVLIGNVTIGARSSVWPNATLRGDDGSIVIGDDTSIQDGSVVHMTEGLSTTTVGHRVTVGHNVTLHGCTIQDDCIIGMGAILLDNAVVETRCIVGAGTVIAPGKRVPSGTVVIGNPMRVLRACSQADLDWIEHSWKAYVARTAQYASKYL